MIRLLAISVLVMIAAASVQGQTPMVEALPGIDPKMAAVWQQRIDEKVQLMTAAYSLDVDMQAAIRAEMTARVLDQLNWEVKSTTELDDLLAKMEAAGGEKPGSPETEAVWAKVAEAEKMPLGDAPVAEWLEARLPQAVVPEGRARWEELREYGELKQDAEDRDSGSASGIKTDLAKAGVAGSAAIQPQGGLPVPNEPEAGRFYPQITARSDERGVVNAKIAGSANPVSGNGQLTKAERVRAAEQEEREKEGRTKKHGSDSSMTVPTLSARDGTPGRSKSVIQQPPAPQVTVHVSPTVPSATRQPPPAHPQDIVYAKAPPLDDWDKYVQDHAKKHGFDDAQLTKAQSVLKDLKRRANQYRMSRSDMYATAVLKSDAKAKDEMLKDLNKPIDAMFDELKQRIDSLMTLEQRERAKAGPEKKPGK